jgi:methionyl-tRNA synthetase
MTTEITIDDFIKCDIRIGTILSADFVEDADKLLVFKIDLGETKENEDGEVVPTVRQILSGIRQNYPDPSVLVGLQVPVLCNLPTRKLRGLESEGMILYSIGEGQDFTTLGPKLHVTNGTQVG